MQVAGSRRLLATLSAVLLLSGLARAGGGNAERAFLITDPRDAESLYVANVYRDARDVPPEQVLYLRPGATDFTEFAAVNAAGFLGTLANRRLRDRVDFVVLAPSSAFYVSTPGVITDGCSPVTRIAIASAYTLCQQADDILDGIFSTSRNHYYDASLPPAPFDSEVDWYFGVPSTDSRAQRYFLGGLLGYTGSNGNTLQDVLDMIARSVAVDGTHPVGTVYYMHTTDTTRSSPRDGAYPAQVTNITNAGGMAQLLFADLPIGQHDCTGIMTGVATPDIDGADMTLLDGSFADHLTSFAGTFDNSSQTKMSRWIAKGASGTAGTVEEPCNYAGKFPHASMHYNYFLGLSLGEAWFRSVQYKPFQGLLYGDPLTTPYGDFPDVDVPDPPQGPQSGVVTITPTVAATAAGASITSVELTVDGVLVASGGAGEGLPVDTLLLTDGWHDLRVLARDDTPEVNCGRWVGSLEVDNAGRSVTIATSTASGDLAQAFDLTVGAAGGTVSEVRVLENGRVVASTPNAADTVRVYGQDLGAGPVSLQAEALFADGLVARSTPVDLAITFAPGTPSGAAPVAYGYARTVYAEEAAVLELPAAFDDDPSVPGYTIVQAPTQAAVVSTGDDPWVVIVPDAGATGTDELRFQVTTPGGTSSVATIALTYATEPSISVYGSGVNPAGSIAVLSGRPVPGQSFQVGLDNPLATQAPGAATFLFFSLAPDPAFPAGTQIPGFGMAGIGAVGELLIGIVPPDPVAAQAGPAWAGAGTPAAIDVAVPADLGFVGLSAYGQGILIDPSGTGPHFGLTDAIDVRIGAF